MTGYELEHSARISVGFFWPFPHSQIYAEPRRLERLGLVTVTEEAGGRRRRVYAVTEDGRAALRAWLAWPPEPAQVRDPAVLRLFFADADPELIGPLARRKVGELQAQLDFLEQPGLGGTSPQHLRVLAWGRAQTRGSLEFWRSVAESAA